MKKIIVLFIISSFFCSCQTDSKPKVVTQPETNAATKTDSQTDEWIYLFDGTSTKGWRAYNGDALPAQWIIKDGALTFSTESKLETDHQGGKDIIYAAQEFENFELYMEWKLPEGGNSGIFYHLQEGYSGPAEIAPQYQLLDDLKWEEITVAKLEE
ncbi:MAG: DUF1080 domain-containing protein, partial [Saprospiraceae bacterium]